MEVVYNTRNSLLMELFCALGCDTVSNTVGPHLKLNDVHQDQCFAMVMHPRVMTLIYEASTDLGVVATRRPELTELFEKCDVAMSASYPPVQWYVNIIREIAHHYRSISSTTQHPLPLMYSEVFPPRTIPSHWYAENSRRELFERAPAMRQSPVPRRRFEPTPLIRCQLIFCSDIDPDFAMIKLHTDFPDMHIESTGGFMAVITASKTTLEKFIGSPIYVDEHRFIGKPTEERCDKYGIFRLHFLLSQPSPPKAYKRTPTTVFLERIGFAIYSPEISEAEVDLLDLLATVSVDDLVEIGIPRKNAEKLYATMRREVDKSGISKLISDSENAVNTFQRLPFERLASREYNTNTGLAILMNIFNISNTLPSSVQMEQLRDNLENYAGTIDDLIARIPRNLKHLGEAWKRVVLK